jgi:hypothetical protein
MGTVDYVAPEQIERGDVDRRADVYSLGCVLYHALTGRVPFEGTPLQKLWQHANAEPPQVSEREPRLAYCDPVVTTAMAKAPEDRYPAAGALAGDARAALRGEAPTLVPGGARALKDGSAAKPVRRRRSPWVRVAVAAAAALVAGALGYGLAVALDDNAGPSPEALLPSLRIVYREGGFETRRPLDWRETRTPLDSGYRVTYTSAADDEIVVERFASRPPRFPDGKRLDRVPYDEVNTAATPGSGATIEFVEGDCDGSCVAYEFQVSDGDGYLVWGPQGENEYVRRIARELIDAPN